MTSRSLRAFAGVALVSMLSTLVATAPAPTSAAPARERLQAAPCTKSAKPFGVGKTTVTLPVAGGRSLTTTIYYPTPSGAEGEDVPPACGHFPLVLAAHGSEGTGATAADLHAYLVRYGYVVAGPTFPAGFDLTRDARDASEVITGVLAGDRSGALPFSGHLRRFRIGFIGTSLGGMIGITTYRKCCLDPRIDAVIAKLATKYGTGYRWGQGPPLLMINGTADTVVAYDGALATYRRARPDKGLISLAGIGHDLLLRGDPILQESSLGFFGHYLKGSDTGLGRLRRAVDNSSVATLRNNW